MKNISETAYLVAMYRALETERKDALIKDLFARRLAGGRGEMLVEVIGDKQRTTTAIAIRTYVIDELIRQVVELEGIDTVLNLAAGLDTRPYRLCLPTSLRWIEVDLPEVLSYKQERLKDEQPLCCLEHVNLDLSNLASRQALFSQINVAAKQVLVITEGLLSYLPEDQVALLAADLHEPPNFRWWLSDVTSSIALQEYDKYYPRKIFDQYFANGNQTLLFAPPNALEFFQQYGWNVAKLRSLWEESLRRKRGVQFARFWEYLMRWVAREHWEKIRNLGTIVLLERE
ncbi:MAG: class I SAM-dependent methyltransferase [Stigonema ocellatum SAG 48.90 = DSM 106950]|nr:class I SAM-dependent methyltransferase [Stigonema ocellatum SAG 48.90 = DSM 106950]